MKRKIRQSFWQGIIKLFVLHQAAVGPVYGGKLSKSLRSLGYIISPGSLYPTLHNLEKAGFLRSYLKVFKGRVRRYYEITGEGKKCLGEVKENLDGVVRILFRSDTTPSEANYAPNLKVLPIVKKGEQKPKKTKKAP
jgi:PadR family transcriptional regulator, regulatory protein PadR